MRVFWVRTSLLCSAFVLAFSSAFASVPLPATPPVACECTSPDGLRPCGVLPAFMNQTPEVIARKLGFDVPKDHKRLKTLTDPSALLKAFVGFLEKSDRSRLFYPEYYTRATQDASVLTLQSKFIPKSPTEMDEYFRCSIPENKYCLYRKKLRPYLGLAAKVSGFDYSFLACQSYVESRFQHDARSSVGAIGFSQIRPMNIDHMNRILKQAQKVAVKRRPASSMHPKEARIQTVQNEIAGLWEEFWKDTRNVPAKLCKNDLTCYRQAFLAQAMALKTDMLIMATTSTGLRVGFDEDGDFRVEDMDKGDSLLILAGSYNLGVTRTIRLLSTFCSGTQKLKECLDRMTEGRFEDPKLENERKRDVRAIVNYVMRIRDCSQQYSAEQLDFDDDVRWTPKTRTVRQNEQRDRVSKCLLNPCPYRNL